MNSDAICDIKIDIWQCHMEYYFNFTIYNLIIQWSWEDKISYVEITKNPKRFLCPAHDILWVLILMIIEKNNNIKVIAKQQSLCIPLQFCTVF